MFFYSTRPLSCALPELLGEISASSPIRPSSIPHTSLTATLTSNPVDQERYSASLTGSVDFLVQSVVRSCQRGLLNCFDCGSSQQRLAVLGKTTADWMNDAASMPSETNPAPDQWIRLSKRISKTLQNMSSFQTKQHEAKDSADTAWFSPANIGRFLTLFWEIWYPNCPILHKPTFCIDTAPVTLLVAMLLIGACLSVDGDDRAQAHTWLDRTEQLVFSGRSFQETGTGPVSYTGSSKREFLQELQAGFLICVCQYWEGSSQSRERTRQLTYSSLIATVRTIGLSPTTWQTPDPQQSEWNQFIESEQLIRTLLYVFLVDTEFTIFHNMPPRLTIPELQMPLACPETCFQARSADEYSHQRSALSQSGPPRASISTIIQTMCREDFELDVLPGLGQLGTLNLFILISALHTLKFTIKASMACGESLIPIKRGLSHWKILWDVHQPQPSQSPPVIASTASTAPPAAATSSPSSSSPSSIHELWKREGFTKHCREYWELAIYDLERYDASSSSSSSQRRLAGGLPEKESAGAEKYDDRTMSEVVDLISWISRRR
ncbi:hypothetical protein BO78DRAFT_313470 [Aspergillus sclerotiicarbonarius CBS 121057]|uniref:Xylanolytic transcriptional activator regulatory domain-containing protein n=1 Tax=Aspergillus sclerotiicarbonarius (strain CBS 121057 / IBT 28362) TaxID=1448318 RepID=A0A319EI09_ASPSB|nr:hypothetical protein BO78DRAFT_313470 [Aspergillus sclerotiicarbonarius CBS 121057]